jgi:tight adherence protein C
MMPPVALFAIVAVFAAVVMLTFAVSLLLAPGGMAGRRLREVTRNPAASVLPAMISLQAGAAEGLWAGAAKILPKREKESNRLRARLSRAGLRSPSAPIIYSLSEVVLPVVLASPALLLLSGPLRWFAVAVGALIGYFGPGVVVERLIKARQREIDNGLPDALDLLVVCIEAGSGLDQALLKAGDELAITYPVLAEELRMVNTEIRAGKPRMEAFKAFAQRTKVDDVRSLVNMLIQTDRFGTGIGAALRTHSETSRIKRRQRAEEAAEKIGVKLVFPLVLFFFPAFYVIVLGPAAIQFIQTFM